MPTIMFVVTTPFAVNAALANHIAVLSKHCKIVLCTNLEAYELLPSLFDLAEVRHIPFARKISPLSDFKSFFSLTALVSQFRPLVIHSITPKAGLIAMLAGLLVGVPNRCHTFTGQVWANKTGLARRLLKGADWLIATLASCVLTDSATQCRLLEKEGIVKKGRISMLGAGSIAGVDPKRFYPDPVHYQQQRKRLGTHENACVFLFVGRIAKDKGVMDLLTAFQNLAREVPQLELWMIGPDEEGLLQTLQPIAICCNAPVRFLGPLLRPELFMVAADVLLLPSHREGFPSTILEAAACGLPTIAFRIYGVLGAVVEDDTGLLVELGQTAALASAMKSLALNEVLRLRLGNKARERTIRDFSSDKVSAAWLDFYINNIFKCR